VSSIDPSQLKKNLIDECWYVSLGEHIIDLAWSPDSANLVAATVDGRIVLIENRGDSAFFRQVGQHSLGANSVSWSPDGERFASAGQDGLVKVFSAESGETIQELKAGNAWVSKVVYSPRRSVLAVAAGKSLRFFNEAGEQFYESSVHASTIADVAWNPRGTEVAVAAYNGVTVHQPGSEEEPRKYEWKGSSLVVLWSPDEKYLATGEQDSTVHFWLVESGEHAQMSGFPTKVLQLSWNSNGSKLATGGGSGVIIWDCSGSGPMGRKPEILECHINKLTALAFQHGGSYLVSTDADGLLCVWEPDKHSNLLGGKSLSSPASCLRWSAKADLLAVGQDDGVVVVFTAPK
jgi:WD40 repeat protein